MCRFTKLIKAKMEKALIKLVKWKQGESNFTALPNMAYLLLITESKVLTTTGSIHTVQLCVTTQAAHQL